jgi:hypothetical protein
MPADGQIGRLLLARAALRQATGDAASARADFQRAAMLWNSLDDAQRLACELGLVRTMLAADELDAALAALRESLQRAAADRRPAAAARLVALADALLTTAADYLHGDRGDHALRLLDGLTEMLDAADIRHTDRDDLRQRIADLRRQTAAPDTDIK